MKKILVFCALIITALSANAQDKKAETLKEIRAMYSKALDDIKRREAECSECWDKITINNSQTLPAIGPHQKTTTFYFSKTDDGEFSEGSETIPYFIRNSYDIAAATYLEEFLFDSNGKMVFGFVKENAYPAVELRVYIKNGIVVLDRKETKETQTHPINMELVNDNHNDVKNVVNKCDRLVEILRATAD